MNVEGIFSTSYEKALKMWHWQQVFKALPMPLRVRNKSDRSSNPPPCTEFRGNRDLEFFVRYCNKLAVLLCKDGGSKINL